MVVVVVVGDEGDVVSLVFTRPADATDASVVGREVSATLQNLVVGRFPLFLRLHLLRLKRLLGPVRKQLSSLEVDIPKRGCANVVFLPDPLAAVLKLLLQPPDGVAGTGFASFHAVQLLDRGLRDNGHETSKKSKNNESA